MKTLKFSNAVILVGEARHSASFYNLPLTDGYILSVVTNSHYEVGDEYIEVALLKNGEYYKQEILSIIPYMTLEIFSDLVWELKGLVEGLEEIEWKDPEQIFEYYKDNIE